jgi:hypothetical protein
MDQLAEDVTLHVPSGDSNRSRWPLHPLWPVAQEAVATRLFAHEARVSPEAVQEVDLQSKRDELIKLIASLSVTLAYLSGSRPEVFETLLTGLPMRILRLLGQHPRGVAERFAEAAIKYGRADSD